MRLHAEEGAASGGLTGWPHSLFRKRQLEMGFTGSGSEYFRMSVVHLLLTLLSLTFYAPFAKARRLRYLLSNTAVDGHALSFHGDPWTMLRGHVLLMALMGLCVAAERISSAASGAALLSLLTVWPALWRAGLQFRLGNTRWRGLRLGFEGRLRDAYLAFAPMLVPLMLLVVVFRLCRVPLMAQAHRLFPDAGALADALQLMLALSWLLPVALLALLPWTLARLARYRHNGYRFADQAATLALRTSEVYRVGLHAAGLWLLIVVCGTGLLMLPRLGLSRLWPEVSLSLSLWLSWPLAVVAGIATVLAWACFSARCHNLFWGRTAADDLQCLSRLPVRPYMARVLRQGVLTLLTLGLYAPFAIVAQLRMRIESLSLTLDADPELWLARQQSQTPVGAKPFSAELLGVRLGL